jgi:hypothetical protein
MAIKTCEACIEAKIKWIASLQLMKRAVHNMGEQDRYPKFQVTMENEQSVKEVEVFYRIELISEDFRIEEEELKRRMNVFCRCLWRYDLMKGKPYNTFWFMMLC